ncbi:MAG TPA: DJ-1/PfpI family protein [Hyphomicrobiaceae bacterium]|nr:DJ-1/PfpI family protein [Hyphomicrobiaceae bacterium]
MTLQIGFLVFPDITQLDMTGPHEVLARLPGATIHLAWKSLEPITAQSGLRLIPTVTLQDCPQLDLICVPGGPGVNPLMNDEPVLEFVRRQAAGARYITSVCTGALVLGAAGLLRGKRATTHWMSLEMLSLFGATPVKARTVVDGNLITGGGVTAGIDFALRILAEIAGENAAKGAQLGIEYDPMPPFHAGSPDGAGPAITDALRTASSAGQAQRLAAARQAAARLGTA